MKHDNRILVVEDQKDLRAILRDLLSASGYSVIEAMDGAESVAKAALERPDLVLMDIQLPVLDGYDATRQIKALPAPCIARPWPSCHSSSDGGERHRATGFADRYAAPSAGRKGAALQHRAGRAAISDGSRCR